MKRVFKVKQKAFFIIFKELSVAKNCLRPESAPLRLYFSFDWVMNSLCVGIAMETEIIYQ